MLLSFDCNKKQKVCCIEHFKTDSIFSAGKQFHSVKERQSPFLISEEYSWIFCPEGILVQ